MWTLKMKLALILVTGAHAVERRTAFNAIDPVCQNYATSIAMGQLKVFTDMVDATKYDRLKRPNTSPIDAGDVGPNAGKPASLEPGTIESTLFSGRD